MSPAKFAIALFLTFPLPLVHAAGNTPSSLSLSSSINPSIYGGSVTLVATVSPSASTGKVTFYEGTAVLGTVPIMSGQAALTTILLTPGSAAVTAKYSGDTTYAASTAAPFTQVVTAIADGGFATPPTTFGLLAAPISVFVADFNHDGEADLAVANISGVSVLLGNGQGSFQQAVQLSTGGVPVGIALGDFNGDGNIDLVVTNQDDRLSVLLGNGNGTFQAATIVVTPSANVGFVAVGDFNSDGNADLVAVDSTNGVVDVLLGNGDGTFQTAVPYAVGNTPASLLVGDFNADGKADLAVLNALSDTVSILLGNGNGTFQPAVNYGTGLNPVSISAGDFNADGKLDLAIANQGGGISVLTGNGDGTFRAASTVNVGSQPSAVVALDFNGDGNTDLAVASYSSNDLGIFLGNGDGTFQTPIDVPAGANPNFIAVGDFNSDGRPDFAVTQYSSEDVGVILGTPKTAESCTFAITVSASQTLPASGGSLNVAIQTGATCGWEVAGLPSWITVSGPSTGMGPGSVTLVIAANTGAQRSAEIDVANNPGMITQLSSMLSINANGVVNAASFSTVVAPGSIAAIYGNFLVAEPISAVSTPISTSLSGISVTFGGSTMVPLFYTSLTQVNIQVPWELAGQTQTTVSSSYGGQTSVAEAVTIATYAPGIFSNDDGTGQGAILDSNFQLVTSTNSAAEGSYVQIYCTGLGPVSNQPATGATAPASEPFAETTTTPVVTIGGVAATVTYSGLAPGTVGEYQVNVQVPTGVSMGTAVPVVISIAGVSSNTVTMGVQ